MRGVARRAEEPGDLQRDAGGDGGRGDDSAAGSLSEAARERAVPVRPEVEDDAGARQGEAVVTRVASRILLLCIIFASYAVAAEPDRANAATAQARNTQARGALAQLTDLKFAHLTTRDGLAMNNVVSILQDHRGFMWFGTGDGLNRYDGNSFVVYKNNPSDPGSLSANFIRDLVEDDHGNLWIAVYPGVNKFDPTTERSTRYLHDPNNPNSLSGESVWSVTRDSRGYLWFATADSGLDRFDPATETFTHYRNDSKGQAVGWITRVIEDSHRDIWFVGERGLFHLSLQTGQITRPPAITDGLSAE